MNNSERARLMHTVLDGEVTEAEARELDRLLAAEPAARTEFEHLQALFEGLSRVPKAFPPEGLVASVMANIPQNSPPQGRPDQLSLRSRVIGLAWMKARGTSPGKSATDLPAHQPGIYLREWKMNEQNSSPSRKRNVLIGGAIAIAAALVALSYTIDFPPGAQNTVGTIVPAQRFRAAQPTADEIKVGGQAATQSVPLQAGSAANAAANSAVNAGTTNAVNAGTTNAVNAGTTNAVNAGTTNAVNAGTTNAVNAGMTNAVNAGTTNAMTNAVNAGTTNAVNAGMTNAVNAGTTNAMTNAVNAGTTNAVNAGTTNAIGAATANAVNASTNNAVNASTTNAVNASTTNAINASTTNAVAK